MREGLAARPGTALTIDLAAQTVTMPGGEIERFEIDPFRKECLLAGIDEIDLTLRYGDALAAYERRQQEQTPWLSPR
jgi:3-isopropylmalate/(R)-2-methylmalate dehydratase small subunit